MLKITKSTRSQVKIIPPLGIYPKKTNCTNSKRHMDSYVYQSILFNSQNMEAT